MPFLKLDLLGVMPGGREKDRLVRRTFGQFMILTEGIGRSEWFRDASVLLSYIKRMTANSLSACTH